MRLMFHNCRLYNPTGTDVRFAGELMSEAWERKWAQSRMEVKVAELQAQVRRQQGHGVEARPGEEGAAMERLAGEGWGQGRRGSHSWV